MAQQSTASSETKSKKQRPKPLELQTSLSESSNNNFLLSPAERYIDIRSQMVFDRNDQYDTRSETPSTASSSLRNGCSTSTSSSFNHAEVMHDWQKKQIDEIYKKEPHRYQYGPPPSSTTRTSPSPMLFKTFEQSNTVCTNPIKKK